VDPRDFLEEYKSIITAAAAFALVIVLFFVCLGYSRSMGSSTPRNQGGSFVTPEIENPSAESQVTEEAPVTDAPETEAPETEPPTVAVPNGVSTTLEDGTELVLVDETVTTTVNLNFRSGPSTSYSVIDQIPAGTSLHRTGVTPTGWSRVDFNEQTGFVSSDYLQ